ncbi:MAG: RNA polymerase sigma factor [Deltaproteobacteria bacterium]|nr:RNA polymerase sigma factor [Deltaproteobacteria bacterium]
MTAITKPEAVPSDDADLVERLRRGDRGAFQSLYMRHAAFVAGVVQRLLGSEGNLDDVMQETFLDVLDDIGTLRDPVKVRSWITAIAVRRATRCLVRQRRRGRLDRKWLAEASQASGSAGTHPRLESVYEALDRLPARLRVPLVLSRVEGMTLEETAQTCGKSVATVKRRIAAAEVRVRRLLDAER